MTIQELLKELGLPSKEIRSRFANKQIKINNILCTALDHVVNIQDGYWDLGDFLMLNSPLPVCAFYFNVKDFFGKENTNIKHLTFLSGYTLITISKKEHFVFITN